ncbi:hypothetical protein MBLNU459_g2749t2 [Dothideomycetes sp. NU459]
MDLSRQEYPAMLATLQPAQAIDVLHDRVRQVGSLNAHIADWLQERRRIEEQYSAGLKKLARRPPPGDNTELGVFSVPWTTLTAALDTLANSHHTLAQKIETDVERPLRDFASTNREMQAMSTIQGNLASMARDIENAEKKNARLADKGGKAATGRVANATSDLDNAKSQWDSQAPYVFENLQAVDETRLNHLRDALTQFQTHEVDLVERNRVSAEQCLNVLLNVETADEIKTFAIRTSSGTTGAPRSRAQTQAERQRSRQSVIGPSAPQLSTPQRSFADDAASQRSGSIADRSEPEKKERSGIKGLKRLGTVLGRRRESKVLSSRPESPERKGSSFGNSFSSRLGRGRDLPAPLEDEETTGRPRSPLRTITSASSTASPVRTDKELPPIDGSAQSLAAAGLLPNGNTNGDYNAQSSNQPSISHRSDLGQLQEPLQPSAAQGSHSVNKDIEPARDADGFSVPPSAVDPISQAEQEAADGNAQQFKVDIRNAPIAEEGADAALANVASTLRMQAPPPASRRAGTVRGRRDQRASVYNPSYDTPEPVIEQASAAPVTAGVAPQAATRDTDEITPAPGPSSFQPAALSGFPQPPASTLSQATLQREDSSALEPSTSSAYLPAGSQRDASMAFESAAPQAPASPAFPPSTTGSTFSPYHGSAQAVVAGLFRPGSRTTQLGEEQDAQSIRSGRSLSSSTGPGHRHPDLNSSGLNTSIIETVSAWFEHGVVTRSVLIGEIALAYNPADFSSPFGTETIRLDNFSALEKVAPNPAFLQQTADKSGEYTVDLKSIARTTVAFKYQVHTPEPAGAQAPLLIAPAWRVEPTQASAILSYSLNPSFVMNGRTSITLSNVVLILHVDASGAKPTSCQSKPVGTFDKNKNLIYWQLGDVTLTPGAAPTKLLARFLTPGEAKPGHVEAKWEVVGEQAHGSGLAISVKEESSNSADPFADESAAGAASWKRTSEVRKLVSGTYHSQ